MNLKKIVVISIFVLLSLTLQFGTVRAGTAHIPDPNQPAQLCLPGVYLEGQENCYVLGPSAYLTYQAYIRDEIANQPERFPQIDESFGQTELGYFRVNDKNNAYFASYDNALNNSNAAGELYEGYTFASYTSTTSAGNQKLYQLTNGNWMRGSASAYPAEPNRFRGVLPAGEVIRPFGWLLKDTPTLTAPGYYEPATGNVYERHTLVEVFEQETIGKSDWYMIAPNEWIHMTQVALVYPAGDEVKPEGWSPTRWVEINLWEQTLAVYENGKLTYATLITTGTGSTYTRPGLFKIYETHESTHMAANLGTDDAYYLMDVPWSMYFDERRALHAQYWHDHLGYKSSHGCVNLSFPDAEWMFEWAEMGDWVFVWDPKGLTPEEPGLFTQHLN